MEETKVATLCHIYMWVSLNRDGQNVAAFDGAWAMLSLCMHVYFFFRAPGSKANSKSGGLLIPFLQIPCGANQNTKHGRRNEMLRLCTIVRHIHVTHGIQISTTTYFQTFGTM